MKNILLAAISICLLVWGTTPAQNLRTDAKDEAAIRAVLAGLVDAWNRGDGAAWGKAFTEDADFTVWNGLYVKGREAIARSHEQIFSTIYKGTKLDMNVRSIRFLRDDVAVVHTEGSVVQKAEAFPSTSQAVPVYIFTKAKGKWLIAVFQNTKKPSQPDSDATRNH
jgi:uncharacterized protein (TIGR02246 family)